MKLFSLPFQVLHVADKPDVRIAISQCFQLNIQIFAETFRLKTLAQLQTV